MQANDHYSSPLRNMDSSPIINSNVTQELILVSLSGTNWICNGWYSNDPSTHFSWTVPVDTINAIFTKV